MTRSARWVAVASGAAVALMVAAGCGSGAGGSPVATGRQRSPRGAELFDAECATCHGKEGRGLGSAPATMGAGALSRMQTAQQLFDYVATKMPLPEQRAGTLPPADYWAIVTFMVVAHGGQVPAAGLTRDNAASVRLR